MTALVTNKTQADPVNANTMTSAAVGGAGGGIGSTSDTGISGIDNSTDCSFLQFNGQATTANTHYSAYRSFATVGNGYDLSSATQAMHIHFKQNNTQFNDYTSATDSLWIGLLSGGTTTDYARWEMNIQDFIDGTWKTLTMSGTPTATGGAWDNTDVTGYFVAIEMASTSGGNFGCSFVLDQLIYINGEVVYEDTGTPATLNMESYHDQVKAISGNTFHSNLNLEVKPVYGIGHPVLFESDDISVSNATMLFLPNDELTGGYQLPTTGHFSLTFRPDLGTASQSFTDCVWAYDSGKYDLTVDSVNLTSGNITFTRFTFLSTRNVTIGGNAQANLTVTIPSPTGTVDISDVSGTLTITGTSSAIQWTADLASGAKIVTDSDLDIEFAETDLSDITIELTASNTLSVSPTTGSGTYNLSGLTTTGTVTLDNKTANNTTIVLPAGTSNTVASPTTGGGSITVDSPEVTFTINTNVSALIRIYTNNTQTILSSTTGTTLAFVHSGQTVAYTIEAAGYISQRFTGVTLSGTTAVSVNLVADPIYNASHGLTRVTDYDYDASTRILTIVANQEGRNLYSSLADEFRTVVAYRNCPFPIVAIGPDRFDFKAVGYYNTATTVGATIDSGDIQFWKGAGMQWEHSTTGNPTKKFYSIKSSNTLQAGSVVGFTQVLAGTPVAATLVSNQVNQVIQFFEDTNGDGTPDYNYTGHLLFKGFLTGYYQARWDVVNDGGTSTLEPYEYSISLTQEAIAGTTGNQSVTITTLTDHTGSPLVVGSKNFDYELVDPGTNAAAVLLAQHNYNVYNAVNTLISGSLYTSYQAFDLPDLLIEAGSNIETERGYFEGDGAATDLSGVYCSRSAADHPGISRFQSNDGTYYTPAVQNQATITNLLADNANRRLYIYNSTTATVIYNDVPGTTYSDSYIEGTDYTDGDQVVIRWAQANGTTDFKSFSTVITASSTGWSLDASNFITENTTYATLGINGATVTGHTADYVDDEADLTAAANFSGENTQAWLLYILTTSQGISDFWGGYTIGLGFIQIHNATVNMYIDNTTATNIRETSNIKIFRDDGAYPVKGGGITTGGGGIDLRYKDPVYIVSTGSGLSASQSAQLTAIESKTNGLTFTVANKVDANTQYMNNAPIQGVGSSGDKWRGV